MQLEQGALSMTDYTSQFEKLCRFSRARVVEKCAKKVALARDTQGENNNRGQEKYFQLRSQSFKRDGRMPQRPQGQGGFRMNNYYQYQHAKGRGKQSKTSPDLICSRCMHFHPYDSCKLGIGGCFTCGLTGHMAKDFPRGRNPNVG
ncbi:hypothetical protein AHAS_Ahas20G0209100 [Arachis hypogaea]